MPIQRKLITGDQVSAIAASSDHQAGDGFGLHANLRRAFIVFKDLLEISGLITATLIDAVKSLGVMARIVINLELAVIANLELVIDVAYLHGFKNIGLPFKVLVRQLEAVIPKRILSGAKLLDLLPSENAVFIAIAAKDLFINDLLLAVIVELGMTVRRVGHHHLMALGSVFEKIKDTLFFHQPTGEVEIRLAVLNAIITRMERALNFKRNIQTFQHAFQNVRDVDMLEDSALRSPGQQPKLRYDLQVISGEDFALAASTLADPITDAVEITFLFVWELERDRDLLPQKFVKLHLTGVFGQEIQLETEKP